jgi:hypothetical protein
MKIKMPFEWMVFGWPGRLLFKLPFVDEIYWTKTTVGGR